MERYRDFNTWIRTNYGAKLYKLALDGGFTCPNRDGKCGTRGCIFCSGGSGDFSIPVGTDPDEAFERAKALVAGKSACGLYIAYYQSYTGTYAPLPRLRELYTRTVKREDVAVLDIATRPDCLGEEVIALLKELNEVKPVWVELGLQTVHSKMAEYIRRGYPLEVYDDAVQRLKAAGLTVITHMILGLPGETAEMMAETAGHIGRAGSDGIKLQLLHVLKGTDLAADYEAEGFRCLTMEEYISALEKCLLHLPENVVIHRLTGDGAKRDLIAPLWSADKKRVLNAIHAALERDDIVQGRLL